MLNFRRLATCRGAIDSSWGRQSVKASLVARELLVPGQEGCSCTTTRLAVRSKHSDAVGLSSLSDPGLNLFPTRPITEAGRTSAVGQSDQIPPEIKDAQLRADIRAMGRILGQVIQQYEGQGNT